MRVLLVLVLTAACSAQAFVPERVVFPITHFGPDSRHLAPFSIKLGTGFCLDPECRFVGTNYHVAKEMGTYILIRGVPSIHRYLDSSPDEAGAERIRIPGFPVPGSMKYTLAHDLAIYEMRRPLKGFQGASFDTDDLEEGEEADIYGYPLGWNPKRGLVRWRVTFLGKNPQGLLAYRCKDGRARPGASGGIVVNGNGKIVGIFNAIGEDDHVALAVPTGQLADFVGRAQPYLQAILFPKEVFVSPVAPDLYPPYDLPAGDAHHQANSAAEFRLRLAARRLADSMTNFIATQTFAWGRDNREPETADAYETLVLDGNQRWHRPSGKKFYDEIPFPPVAAFVNPGAEWSQLPQMVGTDYGVALRQAPDAVASGRTIHVFQYAARADDKVCSFRYLRLLDSIGLGFFRHPDKFYDCHGEVWTDASWVILRISLTMDLTGPSYRYRALMTYGWVEKDGAQHLVPVTLVAQAEDRKSTHWCRGLFTDYGMFGTKTRVLVAEDPNRTLR
jgi:hypothetical protein